MLPVPPALCQQRYLAPGRRRASRLNARTRRPPPSSLIIAHESGAAKQWAFEPLDGKIRDMLNRWLALFSYRGILRYQIACGDCPQTASPAIRAPQAL
jgi:hypothetical protein